MNNYSLRKSMPTSIFNAEGGVASSHHHHANLISDSHKINYPPTGVIKLPFIVSCPHAGIHTPIGFEETLADDTTLLEVLQRGDVYTDWLSVYASEVGATQIIHTAAPSFINVGRSTLSIKPADVRGGLAALKHNPDDPYIEGGQGLVARKTLLDNKEIYHPDKIPTEHEIQHRIAAYYNPYHEALEHQTDVNLSLYNYSLLFDVHSCPSVGTPKDKDFGQERADIIFSNNNGHSSSNELMDLSLSLAEQFGLNARANDPYTGGFNTQKYAANPQGVYEKYRFGEQGSESIQIEFNRATMGIDERTLGIIDEQKFFRVQDFTNRLQTAMGGYVINKLAVA